MKKLDSWEIGKKHEGWSGKYFTMKEGRLKVITYFYLYQGTIFLHLAVWQTEIDKYQSFQINDYQNIIKWIEGGLEYYKIKMERLYHTFHDHDEKLMMDMRVDEKGKILLMIYAAFPDQFVTDEVLIRMLLHFLKKHGSPDADSIKDWKTRVPMANKK